MRTQKAHAGPFAERLYVERHEIESMALDELRKASLLPDAPAPTRVERFIEKRFKVVPSYEDLPAGVLGFTRFGSNGVAEVVVSRSLSEEGTRAAERRVSSTLAHEVGHMLLHGHLFALAHATGTTRLLGDDVDGANRKILCRDEAPSSRPPAPARRGYDGRWWEYQANMMIGPFLLPGPLVRRAIDAMLSAGGSLGIRTLAPDRRDEAAAHLANVFDVNPAVARIRVDELYPASPEGQLSL